MTPEQKENFKAYLQALRSGEYPQTKSYLHTDEGFCCLGVMCDVYRKLTGIGEWVGISNRPECYAFTTDGGLSKYTSDPTLEVAEFFGIKGLGCKFYTRYPILKTSQAEIGGYKGVPASVLNDSYGLSFEEIADCFERTFLE